MGDRRTLKSSGDRRITGRFQLIVAAALVVLVVGCGRSAPADEVAGVEPGAPTAGDGQSQSGSAPETDTTASGAGSAGADAGDQPEGDQAATGSTPTTVPTQPPTTGLVIVAGAGSAVHGPDEAGVRVLSDGPIVAPPAPVEQATTVPDQPGSSQAYTVQAGDTLSGIAEQFGIPVADIAAANGITDVNSIKPGRELIIPVPAAGSADPGTQPDPETQPDPGTQPASGGQADQPGQTGQGDP